MPMSPPPLSTALQPTKDWSERGTPRAQTMQEFEDPDSVLNHSNFKGDGLSLNFCWFSTMC